ncbi:MAG: Fe2+ transport system protein [Anaerocolumna sp.]|nr:Fe2+ transport system protein [Anaerocolumna sp.]
MTDGIIRHIISANDNHSQKHQKGEMYMSLAMINLGETRVIVDLKGKDDVKRHLQDIGFVKGESVKLLSQNDSGLILLVKGVRVAINKGLASKIMVA